MELYLDNGYLDIEKIYDRGLPWQLITGGRGTGKTYGALSMVIRRKIRFIYLRRTQSQVDIISRPEFSPFKTINDDLGLQIGVNSITKYNAAFYHMEENDKGKLVPAGDPLGYVAALSTFSNIRGFDASDIELIIYDEFIPEKHERPIRKEFDALANAYETINRNRELKGLPPVRMLCLSNSNDVANPIFIGLNLVTRAVKMAKRGTEVYEDPARGLGVYLLFRSPISKRKSETTLYKLTAGSDFAEMAINNDFADDKTSTPIKQRAMKELEAIAAIGTLCIYRVKGQRCYYASTHISGSPERWLMTDTDISRFRRNYAWMILAYAERKIECEDYLAETLLRRVLKG